MIDKSELIEMLRNTDTYVSGQNICEHFEVSRNAVWKAINQLRGDGYQIEAVSNRGYILVNTPDVLSKELIEENLKTDWAARELICYAKTDSTNTRIRRLSEEGLGHGALAVADVQTAGRGRRGRSWVAKAGVNISMSLLLRPEISPQKAPMLTLVMALAVADSISELTGCDARIKWPNDIVIDGRKVCGILTEMDLEADYIRNVIVGVGINVNQASEDEFEEEFRDHAGSLRMAVGHPMTRAEIVASVMKYFEKYYSQFMQTTDLNLLKELYSNRLINVEKMVTVLDPMGEYNGIAKGITDTGELIVEKDDGTVINVFAGEVSVRGLYGYT